MYSAVLYYCLTAMLWRFLCKCTFQGILTLHRFILLFLQDEDDLAFDDLLDEMDDESKDEF